MKEVATVGAIFHARTFLFHGIFVLNLTQYQYVLFFQKKYICIFVLQNRVLICRCIKSMLISFTSSCLKFNDVNSM